LYTYALFVYHSAPPPHLHSFPTRRSSDLPFLPSRTNRHPSFASAVRSRGRNDHGDGGVSISVGSMKSAIVSSHASYFGNAAASRVENLLISRSVSALSGPRSSERPSGKGVNDAGLRGNS